MIAMAVALMVTGCKETEGLVYDLTATAKGNVEFTWLNGGAKVNGDAVVYQCNDTTKVFGTVALKDAVVLGAALESDDAELAEAAKEAEKAVLVKVNGVEGEYELSIKGYVKYGPFLFEVDEVYPTPAPAPAE